MSGRRVASLAALLAACAAAPVAAQQADAVIHGHVRDAATGEPVIRAQVSLPGVAARFTDRDGYFALRLPAGAHRLTTRALGFSPRDTTLATGSAPVQIRLRRHTATLEVHVVEAAPHERTRETPEVSVVTITPAQVRQVPIALESDLFRAIQAMPGVISPSAYSSRLHVRGGGADENLFLLDGFPVLHPYHLTGAFSAFHMDAVKDAEVWLAAPPARYGGNLSSVVDVALRDGNREEYAGAASLGVVSSAGVVEGPHPAGAWFVGLRTTYLDVVTDAIGDEVPYRFYDAYAKGYVDVGASDRFTALVFLGQDATWRAGTASDRFDWKNAVYGASWRRLLGGSAVYEQRASFSRFGEILDRGYSALQEANVLTNHDVSLAMLRGDLRIQARGRHTMELGWQAERRTTKTHTEYLAGLDRRSVLVRADTTERETLALYAQDDVRLTRALALRLGTRAERTSAAWSLQPRISAKYLLGSRYALTAGAGLLRQYDHLLQDPDVQFDIYSADVWLPGGTANAPVSDSRHLVAGFEGEVLPGFALRAEAYDKRSRGALVMRPFDPEDPRLALERIEVARATDRGLDVLLRRREGAGAGGWIGYSLGSSRRTVGDTTFAADLHPRHRFVAVVETMAGGWAVSSRAEVSRGVPFTAAEAMIPERSFDFGLGRFSPFCEASRVEYLYGPRNGARTGWSRRLDVGATKRWTRRSTRWEVAFSVINLLFDPVGVFRPGDPEFGEGCGAPTEVPRAYEVILPPIPSVSVRVEF